jgi:peptidoglycan/LPS O-acetylase OafA/YrhL
MSLIKEKLPEIDLLRTLSISIVVLMIHIPNNYAYNFYIELDVFTGFFLHTLGINVALGSFTFLSGFGLYLNTNNRSIDTIEKLKIFLRKRFLRIFPLYWIALILFILFFDFILLEMDPEYILSHFFGLQIILAPRFDPPIWTLWFIGLIIFYYLIFILFSYMGSIKKIIPTSLVILFILLFLHFNFDLIEYRFILYFFPFILGIISADIYSSEAYQQLKEKIKNIHQLLTPISIGIICVISWILYTRVTRFGYRTFLSNFGSTFWFMYYETEIDFIEAVLLTNLIIVIFIIFTLTLFYVIIQLLSLVLDRNRMTKVIGYTAYSTYAVYLFHRPFLICFNEIMLTIFNINMLVKSNFHFTLVSVPSLFILSYFIQRGADKGTKGLLDKLFRTKDEGSVGEVPDIR